MHERLVWIVKTGLNCEVPDSVCGEFVALFVSFQFFCGPLDNFFDIGTGRNDS